jgi:hypothetical protein
MNNSLDKRISHWLTNSLPIVTVTNPVSIHLDDLLGESMADIISPAMQSFLILLEQLRIMQMPVKPGLVIPLVSLSNKIERAIPENLTSLKKQLCHEPPSLYLLDWATSEHQLEGEAYWSPLSFSILDVASSDIQIYYKEIRYSLAIKDDWEFARAVYVEACLNTKVVMR